MGFDCRGEYLPELLNGALWDHLGTSACCLYRMCNTCNRTAQQRPMNSEEWMERALILFKGAAMAVFGSSAI